MEWTVKVNVICDFIIQLLYPWNCQGTLAFTVARICYLLYVIGLNGFQWILSSCNHAIKHLLLLTRLCCALWGAYTLHYKDMPHETTKKRKQSRSCPQWVRQWVSQSPLHLLPLRPAQSNRICGMPPHCPLLLLELLTNMSSRRT